MTSVSAGLQRLIVARAEGRCEYCRLSQDGQEATFHVDHITPVVAGGETTEDNLALACVSCSLRKGARQVVRDPETGTDVPLFHPRRDDWKEHFNWYGVQIVGRTPTGRATIEALKMNRDLIVSIRSEEMLMGRHPYGQDGSGGG